MDKITLAGLPRSGTSMMMRVLERGGIKCEYDETPDDRKKKLNNPHGCFEKIKPQFTGCVKCYAPRLVKIIPEDWKIIYIDRDVDERIMSWDDVKKHRTIQLRKSYETKLERQNKMKDRMMESLKDRDVLFVDYNQFVNHPEQYRKSFEKFLGKDFDFDRAVTGVDKKLWKNRKKHLQDEFIDE